MPEILISIKPKYVDLILSGRKTVELRRQSMRIPPRTRLLLYASSPRRAVVGEARVSFREDLCVEEIWARHGAAAAVSRDELDAYYARASHGVVLGLAEVRRYPASLSLHSLRDARKGFRPPQSYMRVPAFLDALLRELLGELSADARGHGHQDLLPFVAPAE
jgi:predicted transcriptional regulator